MSLEYITKVLTINVNPTQKLILIVLANYSNEFGESYPSHKRLTQLTGLSLSAIKDNLKTDQEAMTTELSKEIKILAKTISLINKWV